MTQAVLEDKVQALTDGQEIHRFCLAGNATFTIQSRKTGERFTYKVVRKPDRSNPKEFVWFVNLLTGPNNEADFRYLGIMRPYSQFKFSFWPKWESPAARAFDFFWKHLDDKMELHPGIEFFHAGRCCVCGRTLTVPESVESGIGPECRGKMGI